MSEAPQHGACGPLFEDAAETMDVIRIQAEIGARYAEIGDDIGLAYVTRNIVAYVKATLPVVKRLREECDELRKAARGGRVANPTSEVPDGPR